MRTCRRRESNPSRPGSVSATLFGCDDSARLLRLSLAFQALAPRRKADRVRPAGEGRLCCFLLLCQGLCFLLALRQLPLHSDHVHLNLPPRLYYRYPNFIVHGHWHRLVPHTISNNQRTQMLTVSSICILHVASEKTHSLCADSHHSPLLWYVITLIILSLSAEKRTSLLTAHVYPPFFTDCLPVEPQTVGAVHMMCQVEEVDDCKWVPIGSWNEQKELELRSKYAVAILSSRYAPHLLSPISQSKYTYISFSIVSYPLGPNEER